MAAMAIEEVKNTVSVLLKKILKAKDVKVIKVARVDDGWETESEVYEENAFIKSLGLSTKAQDHHLYEVKLDHKFEIQSYGRKQNSNLIY